MNEHKRSGVRHASRRWALMSLIALLLTAPPASAAVVINEIVYNDGTNFDSGDWVELFNDNDTARDVSAWILTDDGNKAFTNPPSTSIGPYGYLVVYSKSKFTTAYPSVTNAIGPSDIGFKKDEEVHLYDETGEEKDEVDYECGTNGWPDAEGNDHSIELVYPYEDNNVAANWRLSADLGGSPGARNPGANGIDFTGHDREPDGPTSSDPAVITVQIRDAFATLTSVVINVNWGDGYHAMPMSSLPSDQYTITLPATNDGTVVRYYFHAADNAGQELDRWWSGTNEPYLYVVDNDPIYSGLVINEIMYNSSNIWAGDGYEYVEIYNTLTGAVNIGLWRFQDEGNKFRMPETLPLERNGYLVLADKTQAVLDVYGTFPSNAVMVSIPELGLRNSGENLRWQNANGQMIDEVAYDDASPWPEEPDGNGPSLELRNWRYDNTLPSSWDASIGFGTPGRINSVVPEPLSGIAMLLFLGGLLVRHE